MDYEDIQKLRKAAEKAFQSKNYVQAGKHYEMLCTLEPDNWRNSFFATYCSVSQCVIAQIAEAANQLSVAAVQAVHDIADGEVPAEEKYTDLGVVATQSSALACQLAVAAYNHYKGISPEIQYSRVADMRERISAAFQVPLCFMLAIEEKFPEDKKAYKVASIAMVAAYRMAADTDYVVDWDKGNITEKSVFVDCFPAFENYDKELLVKLEAERVEAQEERVRKLGSAGIIPLFIGAAISVLVTAFLDGYGDLGAAGWLLGLITAAGLFIAGLVISANTNERVKAIRSHGYRQSE